MQNYTKPAFSIFLSLLFWSVSQGQQFSVSYSSGSADKPFSGKVFLYLSKESRIPKEQMIGVEKFPCFSITVKNIKPNQQVLFTDAATSYPVSLSDIERGDYYIQAVWDKNLGGRSIGNSPGNIFNNPVFIKVTKNRNQVYNIVCDQTEKEPAFTETAFIKEVKLSSKLLTGFYKRPTTINAAVILPREYADEPNRKFPVLYWISGYGGDYHAYSGADIKSAPIDTTPCIRVFLDGNCSRGHSVYANSDNNGPWGDALTQELIPEIEKNYRCNAARLLTGHSSGGWTVLWLQTHYPKVFTACWSSSPDPVDFRSFQEIDLYKEKNMVYGKDSTLRLVGTIAGRFPWINMKSMLAMENVIYRGEQMHSFDAVFSTKNAEGEPARICNNITGEIDPVIFEHWKNYDISLYLRSNWEKIKNDLDGKIRVSVGNQDNFLLNYSVKLLDSAMKPLDTHFVFAYYPGDHFTVSTPEYKTSGYQFLQQKYNDFIKH